MTSSTSLMLRISPEAAFGHLNLIFPGEQHIPERVNRHHFDLVPGSVTQLSNQLACEDLLRLA